MEKSFLILCVNYNSYQELDIYTKSIMSAVTKYAGRLYIDIKIADNTTENISKFEINGQSNVGVQVYSFNQNLGYMGGVMSIIKNMGASKVKEYDFVVISNVDLTLSESFFEELFSLRIERDIGWIAPKIFSLDENRDRNPKIIKRPTYKRIEMLITLFKYPFLYNLYTNYLYKYRNKEISKDSNRLIYAGHGSFMIFTKVFMEKHASFNFPSFLFGEELFFGELARSSKLKVLYAPNIVVNDSDHVSTSKLRRKTYCKMNYESLKKLKPLFVNE